MKIDGESNRQIEKTPDSRGCAGEGSQISGETARAREEARTKQE